VQKKIYLGAPISGGEIIVIHMKSRFLALFEKTGSGGINGILRRKSTGCEKSRSGEKHLPTQQGIPVDQITQRIQITQPAIP